MENNKLDKEDFSMEEKKETDTEELNEQASEEIGQEENDSKDLDEVSEETGEIVDEETDGDSSDEEGEEDSSEAVDEADGKKSFGKQKKAAEAYKKGAKGGFFHRKDEKDKKSSKIDELTDQLRRQMAEFENFRKRSDKEKSQMYDMGAKSMIEKILPVVDNFERGLDGLSEEENGPFAEGMRMVYKQLMTVLTEAGVSEIVALGETFDPERHNAVMHVDDEQYGENEIVEVMQKGYTYHDSVVRYSMVKVAN